MRICIAVMLVGLTIAGAQGRPRVPASAISVLEAPDMHVLARGDQLVTSGTIAHIVVADTDWHTPGAVLVAPAMTHVIGLWQPLSPYRIERTPPDRFTLARALHEMNAINDRRPRALQFKPLLSLIIDTHDVPAPVRIGGAASRLFGAPAQPAVVTDATTNAWHARAYNE